MRKESTICLLACVASVPACRPSAQPSAEQPGDSGIRAESFDDTMETMRSKRPNIVIIMTDDMGYSDISCYGSEIMTPNIDRLAERGIRFRTFFNNARSAPTRASLLTGLYPHRAGVGSLNPVAGYQAYQGYPKQGTNLIPETLKDAGYFSIITGKWHLNQQKCPPPSRGFDRSIAYLGGWYYSDDEQGRSGKNIMYDGVSVNADDPRFPSSWYSTDLWTDKGLEFVDEALSKGQPFFWYLAYNAPHTPLQAPKATIAKYRERYAAGFEAVRSERWERMKELGIFGGDDLLTPASPHRNHKAWSAMTDQQRSNAVEQMAIYAACLDEVDRNVGKVLDSLTRWGVLDNTVIFFLSDNGATAKTGYPGKFDGADPGAVGSEVFMGAAWAEVANTPYFLYKRQLHNGGCCSPFIVSWPAGIPEPMWGSIDTGTRGHVIDIMPTIIDLAGGSYPSTHGQAAVPPMDGVSLLPAFAGHTVSRGKPLFVEHEGSQMLIDGDWKIVREYEEVPLSSNPWRLYDLENDPTEMCDLSSRYPERLSWMIGRYEACAAEVGVESSLKWTVETYYVPVRDYPACF